MLEHAEHQEAGLAEWVPTESELQQIFRGARPSPTSQVFTKSERFDGTRMRSRDYFAVDLRPHSIAFAMLFEGTIRSSVLGDNAERPVKQLIMKEDTPGYSVDEVVINLLNGDIRGRVKSSSHSEEGTELWGEIEEQNEVQNLAMYFLRRLKD